MDTVNEKEMKELIDIYPDVVLTFKKPSLEVQVEALKKNPLLITMMDFENETLSLAALHSASDNEITDVLSVIPKHLLKDRNLLIECVKKNIGSILYFDPEIINIDDKKYVININYRILKKFPQNWIDVETFKEFCKTLRFDTNQIVKNMVDIPYKMTHKEIYEIVMWYKEKGGNSTDLLKKFVELSNKIRVGR